MVTICYSISMYRINQSTISRYGALGMHKVAESNRQKSTRWLDYQLLTGYKDNQGLSIVDGGSEKYWIWFI